MKHTQILFDLEFPCRYVCWVGFNSLVFRCVVRAPSRRVANCLSDFVCLVESKQVLFLRCTCQTTTCRVVISL